MGILQTIGIKREKAAPARPGGRPPGARPGGGKPGAGGAPPKGKGKGKGVARKGPGARVSPAAAPLHDRRKRLVAAREQTLRDLGGLMLEMYKRNRFREELLLDKCEEVLAIEVEIAHVDQRLFQLAPSNSAGQRPIGRCECGSPILPGQNFCGVCGRAFGTLTQPRSCARCGSGLRTGDSFCSSCGTQAPDLLEVTQQPLSATAAQLTAPELANAAADTIVPDAPPLDAPAAADGAIEATIALVPPPIDEAGSAPAAAAAGSAAEATAVLDAPPVDGPLAFPSDATTGTPAIESEVAITAAVDTAQSGEQPATLDPRTARKVAREKSRRVDQIKKARAKAAKQRAKEKARAARQRGDGGK